VSFTRSSASFMVITTLLDRVMSFRYVTL